MLRLFIASCLLLAATDAALSLASITLKTCPIGIGFAPYPAGFDSRTSDNIICSTGAVFSSQGIVSSPTAGLAFAITLRPLKKGLVRQGFKLSGLGFSGTLKVGLISVCVTSTAPNGLGTGSGTTAQSCGGGTQATSGSPYIEDTTTTNVRNGWQIFNPSSAVVAAATNTISCAVYWPVATTATVWSFGYITVGAYYSAAAPITASCVSVTAIPFPGDSISQRQYGSNTAGYLTYVNAVDGNTVYSGNAGATTVFLANNIGAYANYGNGFANNALGFQLGCAAATVDESKWILFNFWNTAGINVYATTDPSALDTTVILKATCQNVATSTPTPPFYPAARIGTPSAIPFPIAAGTGGSSSATFKSCVVGCTSAARQDKIVGAISSTCLQSNNVGCSTTITCLITSACIDIEDTTTLTGRRGLKQSSGAGTVYQQIVVVTSRDIRTLQYLISRVRAGLLEGELSAYSWINAVVVSPSLVNTPVPVPPPSTVAPNFVAPSPNMPWTGLVQVQGTCTAGACSGGCANGPIVKVSNFAQTTTAINCFCLNCNAATQRSLLQAILKKRFQFESTACVGSLATQTAADACAANVAQDVVCWALNTPGVPDADIAAILSKQWLYQPPAVAGGAPRPFVAAPNSCPDNDDGSNKGLLGLLGLLGIIPIVLCCCLLLLCLLRRKKREGDVHFATFDPQAANMGAPCSVPAMGLSHGVPCM